MRSEITSELKQAFASDLKDAVKSYVLIRKTHTANDWVLNDNTESVKKFDGKGVFTGYSVREIDGETIKQGDVKLIALLADNEPIQLDDEIDGKQVINVRIDAAGVAQTVQLRSI